jgi:hypothetical protein
MAANMPESKIPQTATGWFWQCGLVLNIKEVFSSRIHPLDLGEYMLS